MNVSVSVIIPTYNREHLLLDALAQLKQQSLKEIEFIIIDDGSVDNSYDMLLKETKQDRRFTILTQDHQGPSAARNKGLAKARGEYIGFFDIDDKIPDNYFSELYRIANEQNADIVYTSYNSIPHRYKSVATRADRIKSLRNGAIWDKLYKKELITKNHIQFAEGLYTADNLWCIQTFSYAENVALVNAPSYQYKLQPDSIGKDKTKINKRKNDIFIVISKIKSFCDRVEYTSEEMTTLTNFLKRSYDCYPSDKKYSKKLYKTLGLEYTPTKRNSQNTKMLLFKLARLTHIINKDKYREKKCIALIESSPLFDKKWYLAQYPDVKEKKIEAASHYFKYGWREGRNPSQLFDGSAYLRDNADVAFYNICPLVHYITNGKKEGRGYVSTSGQSCDRVIPSQKRKSICLQKMREILTYPLRVKDECENLEETIQIKSQTAPSSVADNVAGQSSPHHHESALSSQKTIIVKNAEDYPDTTAEIIVQNQIDYIPKVSVIIPVYNVEQYLRECLDSIINQTLKEIEIICVDDGSTDSSLDILKEYAAKDKRMTIAVQSNCYCNISRNNAINFIAKGEYLGFVDSDDYINEYYYESLYNSAKKYNADISATSSVKCFYEETYFNKGMGISKSKDCLVNFDEKKQIILKTGVMWNKIYRRDFIKTNKIIFYPTRSEGGDNYFTCMSIIFSNKISVCTDACYYYRQTTNSIVHKTKGKESLQICDVYKAIFNDLNKSYLSDTLKLKWNRIITERFCKNLKWITDCCSTELKDAFIMCSRTVLPEIVVSLTSYPARINTVNQTIETLLNQTMKADKVILWLAPEQFPNKEKDLPRQLLDLREKGLIIDWYHDIRSYKKLIPTLKKYPDAIIVTADDDALYNEIWLKTLYISYLENPQAIHCHRVHKIKLYKNRVAPYKKWERNIKKSEIGFSIFFTGLWGVLYPPHSLLKNVLNEEVFMELCPQADDIWFWANAILNNTKIKHVKNASNPSLIDGTQDTALWLSNMQKNMNDVQLHNVIKKYPQIVKILRKEQPEGWLFSYLFFPLNILKRTLLKRKLKNFKES